MSERTKEVPQLAYANTLVMIIESTHEYTGV